MSCEGLHLHNKTVQGGPSQAAQAMHLPSAPHTGRATSSIAGQDWEGSGEAPLHQQDLCQHQVTAWKSLHTTPHKYTLQSSCHCTLQEPEC